MNIRIEYLPRNVQELTYLLSIAASLDRLRTREQAYIDAWKPHKGLYLSRIDGNFYLGGNANTMTLQESLKALRALRGLPKL